MRKLRIDKSSGLIVAGLLAAALIVGDGMQATQSVAVEMLRIGGTGSSIGMSRVVGAAYLQQNGGTQIEVVESLGSSGGIKALMAKVIDISFSSRALKDKEQGNGVVASPILRTPFVAVTSHPEARDLSTADLVRFYGQAGAKWADGTPVRVILRPNSESDTKLLANFFPGMADAMAAARARGEVPVATTDQINAAMAEATTGTLTNATMLQMLAERRHLRILSIDGVAPTLANMVSGDYPYAKTLYVVHRENPSPAVTGFLAFLRSPAGTAELEKIGAVPAS
jgi:phosphate transport system substrate-binding protein